MEAIDANFDLATMFVVNVLASTLSLLCFAAMACQQQPGAARTSLQIGAVANAVQMLGFGVLLIPAWDVGFPHLISLANLPIDAGPALGLVAVNVFLGRPARANWPVAIPIALGLVQIGYVVWGSDVYDWVLMLLGCISRMSVLLPAAWALWRYATPSQRGPARLAACFHLLWAGLLALRIGLLLDGDTSQTDLAGSSILGLAGRFMLTWMIAVCLLWMIARQLDEQLIQHATRDPLTGLLNRRMIWEAGRARGSRAMALILLDIDHFKDVNDHWGHGVGDQVLTMVAGVIAGAVRDEDLVGRVGGEEFMVLPAATGTAQVAALAERIRTAIAGTVLVLDDGQELRCTVSIGHAGAHGGEGRWERLVAEADAALYAAKHGGRDRVVAYAAPVAADRAQNARVMPMVAAVRA